MTRILAGVLVFLGIFTIPWAIVFAAVILFTAFFSWYAEAVLVGSLAALISDVAWWKFFLVFAFTLAFQEWLKKSVNYEKKFIASFWIWIAGLLAFLAIFFALI